MTAFAPLPPTTMRAALEDVNLLGRVMAGPSWLAWKVTLVAAMGESLTAEERPLYTKLTGREREPLEFVEQFLCVAGRRAGKSLAAAVLIVFLSVFRDYRQVLTLGERVVVLCLGQTQEQARVVFGYVCGILENTPLLSPLVSRRSARPFR